MGGREKRGEVCWGRLVRIQMKRRRFVRWYCDRCRWDFVRFWCLSVGKRYGWNVWTVDLFDYGNFCRAREKGIGMLFGERGTRFLASEVDGFWVKMLVGLKVNVCRRWIFLLAARIYDSKRLCKVIHAWMNLCIGNYRYSILFKCKYFVFPNVLQMTEKLVRNIHFKK